MVDSCTSIRWNASPKVHPSHASVLPCVHASFPCFTATLLPSFPASLLCCFPTSLFLCLLASLVLCFSVPLLASLPVAMLPSSSASQLPCFPVSLFLLPCCLPLLSCGVPAAQLSCLLSVLFLCLRASRLRSSASLLFCFPASGPHLLLYGLPPR